MSDILSAKRDLRRVMEEKRQQLALQHPDAALALRDHFLKNFPLAAGNIVAIYHAHNSEINPAPLAAALHAEGYDLALPVIAGRAQPLLFRVYETGDMLVTGPLGIMHPPAEAPSVEPDILLVPLLAFDRRGFRLGYGGGYYDRTLAELRSRRKITAVGLAYARQEMPEIPIEPHDVRLDMIATETGLCQKPAP